MEKCMKRGLKFIVSLAFYNSLCVCVFVLLWLEKFGKF